MILIQSLPIHTNFIHFKIVVIDPAPTIIHDSLGLVLRPATLRF